MVGAPHVPRAAPPRQPTVCARGRRVVPTPSYAAVSSPEFFILAFSLSLSAALGIFTVYHVHRGAASLARYGNVSYANRGNLVTSPKLYCIPLCMCRCMRPNLFRMLMWSEVAGYFAFVFLLGVGWCRLSFSYQLHWVCLYLFDASAWIYMVIFTLCQHNIRKKCPAAFHGPWRYRLKAAVLVAGAVVATVNIALSVHLAVEHGDDDDALETSDVRRVGYPVMEWIAYLLFIVFLYSNAGDVLESHAARGAPGQPPIDSAALKNHRRASMRMINTIGADGEEINHVNVFPEPVETTAI